MENEFYYKKINAYVEKTMGPQQRLEFEAELNKSQDLQKALLNYIVHVPSWPQPTAEEEKIRIIANEIRERSGPLVKPRLNWLDYLRFSLLEWPMWKILVGLIIPIFLLLIIWVNQTLNPINPKSLSNYFIEPHCIGEAGARQTPSSDLRLTILYRSSGFYCQNRTGGIDSMVQVLTECQTFCIAQYYLAHAYFKNNQYDQAVANFEACLENQETLKQYEFYNSSRSLRLKFNLILAKLGINSNDPALKEELKKLIDESQEFEDLNQQAKKLYRDLVHPLRVIVHDLV